MVAALIDALPDCLHGNAWRHRDVVSRIKACLGSPEPGQEHRRGRDRE
jgi:hypothetical protein